MISAILRGAERTVALSSRAYLVTGAAAVAGTAIGAYPGLPVLAAAVLVVAGLLKDPGLFRRVATAGVIAAGSLPALFPGFLPFFGAAALAFVTRLNPAARVRPPRPVRESIDQSGCPHEDYSGPGARAPSSFPGCKFLDGARMNNVRELWTERWAEVSQSDEPLVVFGGLPYTLSDGIAEHGYIIGNSGSGKSLMLGGILSGALPNRIAFTFDFKRTMYPAIVGAMPFGEDQVSLLNPLDRRGLAWNMAADLSNPLATRAFAESLREMADSKKDYWNLVAPEGNAAVLDALNNIFGEDWSPMDFFRALQPTCVRRILARSDTGRRFLATTLSSDSKVGDRPGDVLATMVSHGAQIFLYLLAAEEQFLAGRRFSLRDCALGLTPQTAIVLQHDAVYASAFEAMNRAIFKTFSDQLLSVPGRFDQPRALLVLDEYEAAARALPAEQVLRLGREKGISVWMAGQSLSGLQAALGTREEANAILGAVRSQCFLLTSDVETAERASTIAGKQTFQRTIVTRNNSYNESVANGENGRTTTRSWNDGNSENVTVVTEPLLQPSALRTFPPPGPTTGLTAYCIRDGRQWLSTLDFNWVVAQAPTRAPIPEELRVDVESLVFRPWTDAEVDRFLADDDPGSKKRFRSDPDDEE